MMTGNNELQQIIQFLNYEEKLIEVKQAFQKNKNVLANKHI